MGFRIINGVRYPVGNFPVNNDSSKHNINKQDAVTSSGTPVALGMKSFKDILGKVSEKKEGFTISNHAAERMEKLKLNSTDLDKINEAINKAEDKGAKNCLIVYKEVAMVTSIENRTVITAVEGARAKENVFTNIDSVVFAV